MRSPDDAPRFAERALLDYIRRGRTRSSRARSARFCTEIAMANVLAEIQLEGDDVGTITAGHHRP